MVKYILVALVLAANVAHADDLDRVTKLGFRVGYGAMPLDQREARTTALGLGVEHPVFGKTRAFGEWEWMWINDWDDKKVMDENLSPLHGSGQRLSAGLRRALGVKAFDSFVRVFFDGEIGGGAMITSEDRMGTSAVPVGIAGFRLGYDFRNGDSSSRVFEAEFMLRAVIVPTGYGLMFGVGMLWGD